MKITLSNPYDFDGVTYTEFEADLDALTGRDVVAAKREWARQGNFSVMITADAEFAAFLAAKAAKKPYEFFDNLPAKDYCRISQEVINFLNS